MKARSKFALAAAICLQTAYAIADEERPSQETAAASILPKRFDELAGRYWTIVSDRPRRGTAFDLWYQHYLDAGRLSELVEKVERFVRDEPHSANAFVLLGLVHERQGRDAEAVDAYERAESLAPKDFVPPLLRGRLLSQLSQPELAAAALAKVLTLNPPRAELHEAYKQLGRLQLRLGNREDALQTWSALADAFPNEQRVHEELAILLADENQLEPAIKSWQRVSSLSKDDPYTQLRAQMAVAELHSRLGNQPEALALFDAALDSVDSQSWVADDILRRIESLFEHSDDAEGWIAWCRHRQQRRPRNLPALLTLARALSNHGSRDEALTRLRLAIELAPSRRDIRKDLIHELEKAGQLDAALDECAALVDLKPDDAESLIRLGQLHLQAGSPDDETAAQRRAVDAWKRIAAIRPDDPALALLTAETCRRGARISPQLERSQEDPAEHLRPAPEALAEQSPLLTAAEEYYREALRRSNAAPQYIEYFGEFLHALGRRDEAVETWAQLAPRSSSSAADWHRLSVVYAGFGYAPQAVQAARDAAALAPDDYALREFLIQHLLRAKEFDAAVTELAELQRLAVTPGAEEAAIRLTLDVYVAAERIDEAITQLIGKQGALERVGRDDWLLGLLYASREDWDKAAHSLEAAIARYPERIALAVDYADTLQRAGKLEVALQQFRRLAETDERGRVAHYERIVDLELRIGTPERALNAAEELIQLAPSNIAAYLLKASISRHLKRLDVTLGALRRAAKLDPGSIEIRSELARTLADLMQPHESLEQYWRCLELSGDVQQQLSITSAMAQIAEEHDRLDQLIGRLRRLRERQTDRKPITLCIAQALHEADRTEVMKQELVGLLAQRPNDLDVLVALQEVNAQQQDWRAAIGWQEQVVKIDDGVNQLQRLAELLGRAGDYDAAGRIWRQILIETDDDRTLADAADARWRQGDVHGALALSEAAVVASPQSWRLRLLAGIYRLAIDDPTTAIPHFEAILEFSEAPKGSAAAGATNSANSLVTLVSSQQRARNGVWMGVRRQVVLGSAATAQGQRTHQIYSPEYVELHTAATTYEYLKQVVAMKAFENQGRHRGAQTVVRQAFQLVDDSLHKARVGSAAALALIAVNKGQSNEWLAQQRAAGESDLSRLRLIVTAVYSATGRMDLIPDIVDRLATALPEDPLPHVARLYRVSTQNYRSLNSERRNREIASLKKSYRWLDSHRPEVIPLIAHNYVTSLVSLGNSEGAAEHLSQELNSADSITDLHPVIDLAFEIGAPDFHREFLAKAALLAQKSPETAETADSIATVISAALRSRIGSESTRADRLAIVAMMVRYLKVTAPQQLANARDLGYTFKGAQPPGATNQAVKPPWVLYYSVFRNRAGQSRLRVEVKPFPPLNPLLDGLRYHTLQMVATWLRAHDHLLIDKLQVRVDDSKGVVADSFRMATACALWWSGKQAESMQALDELCAAYPGNDGLRLVQAIGYINADKASAALRSLGELQTADSTMATNAGNLRHAALSTLVQGDAQQLLEGFRTELEADWEPTLGAFFGRALPSDTSGLTMRAAGKSVLDEKYSDGELPISRLLDQFWQEHGTEATADSTLVQLIEAARKHHQRFPANSELNVALALLLLAADEMDDAITTIDQWGILARSRPELIKSPEAWVLVQACLGREATKELGKRLARQVLRVASKFEKRKQVVSDWTAAIASDASVEIRREFLLQLSSDLDIVFRGLAFKDRAIPTYWFGHLTVMHPSFVLDALELLAGRDADKLPGIAQLTESERDAFGRDVHEAVQRALPSLPPHEQERMLNALSKLVFPQGPDGAAVLYEWSRESTDSEPGSLGQTVISLANSLGQLGELRDLWEAHPLGDSLSMICLRAEAAFAADDIPHAERLVSSIKELAATTEATPPLWSRFCRSRVFTDHEAAQWVLSLGGGSSVAIEPGGRVRNIADLGDEKFVVTDIRLIALTEVRDEDLERFRELRSLKTLSLSYTRVSNTGLEHLAGLSDLEILRLSGTNITDAGLKHLHRLTSLKSLMLQNTEVTKAGIEELREALPNCDVEF